MPTLNPATVKRVVASVDWGYTNPGVIQVWAVDHDDRMYLVHEVYYSQKLIDWWVERAKTLQAMYGITVFVCDPAEPAYIEAFSRAGLNTTSAKNDLAPGIQAVQKRLQVAGDGRPRLYFLRDARIEVDETLSERKKPTSTLEEIDGYVWEQAKEGKAEKELPLKVDDHGMDALRYAVRYVDEAGDMHRVYVS